jgi:hypothetical protein
MINGSAAAALHGTPLTFRTAARTMIRNWAVGTMTFVLPDGRELRLEGAEHDRFRRRLYGRGMGHA